MPRDTAPLPGTSPGPGKPPGSASRAEFRDGVGAGIAALSPEMLMGAGEMVDAALAGLELGERVAIPSLPDTADWERLQAARLAFGPDLSRTHAAARYRAAAPIGQGVPAGGAP